MAESLPEMTDVAAILRYWEDEHQISTFDPTPTLARLAEIIEAETENYMKMDPDPFDERHPSRVDTECSLGQILKILFRKDTFMTKLVNDYLRDNYWSRAGSSKDSRQLNITACRLMLDLLPGLEISAVFQLPESESLIFRLFSWAERSPLPLQTYATGLLAAAMEVQDIATNFREQNARLVPLKLQELHQLQKQFAESRHQTSSSSRPFAHLGQTLNGDTRNGTLSPRRPKGRRESHQSSEEEEKDSPPVKKKFENLEKTLDECVMSPPPPGVPVTALVRPNHVPGSECSNSSWAEMESFVIGSIQMFPITLSTRQILILRYLTPMGEYLELLSHVFEQNALELIINYINVRETRDSRLAFEALKYLAALLCHKKFSIEFLMMRGLQMLLKVPRPSVAATGVSICLYYLAYCEDAMERVCQMSHSIIVEVVKYALWLLECSHDSGRCHATMFFGLSYQFRVILAEFDRQDGLRKLYNLISTLPIMSLEGENSLNEDAECSSRQIVRHVCLNLKRYLEAHVCIKAESLRRTQFREIGGHLDQSTPLPKVSKVKCAPEDVSRECLEMLELMPVRAPWEPVDQLLRLGGVTLLLQVIALAYEWNYAGRAETVKSALDALAICSLSPQVQLLFCENVDLPDEGITVGINIVLGAAEGEIVADSEVQKAALNVLIICVCAPIHRIGGSMARFSATGTMKKKTFRTSEELIGKMWESVRSNNGIMVLLQLMMVKTPITDADSVRALACQALAGLARSETVRQIISKLPLFTNGQLQLLMRDPILQEKRLEHVSFQKHALELMERVSGKSKTSGQELESSLANIHRANVVAQTRILYNDRQLYQLITQHLMSRGLAESASVLHREAGLPGMPIKQTTSANFTPFCYSRPRVTTFSPSHRTSQTSTSSPLTRPIPSSISIPSSVTSSSRALNQPSTPIRISLSNQWKTDRIPAPSNSGTTTTTTTTTSNTNNSTCRSLQKQISADFNSPVASCSTLKAMVPVEPHVTLESIVTEYLTNQHALCKNPVVPCPQFNLFEPHKCPGPKAKNLSPVNVVARWSRRQEGGFRVTTRLDRRLTHSRFCPVRTFRPTDLDGFFTCATFLPNDLRLLIGTYQGEVKMFNLNTGVEENSFSCHESYIYNLEASTKSQLLLTSCTWRRPLSALWYIHHNTTILKYSLDDEDYAEFSKGLQDRIIGTKGEIASIYDISTSKKIMTLQPTISNQYTKNRATFHPVDDLVLSDGVLWDIKGGKEVHKLDKLNQTTSGIFHPAGLEILSNTEVWDLRTFHLLRTVPLLDQSQVFFSPDSDMSAMYSISLEQEMDEETCFDSSFKTFDAHDYSSIATIEVKKNIYDLCINGCDMQIALVENQGVFDSVQESSVRLYDVGRRRDDDDEGEDEDDDDDMDGSDDNSGSVSGSDTEQQDSAARTENQNGDEDDDDANEESNNEDDDDEDDVDFNSLLASGESETFSFSDSDDEEPLFLV